MMFRPNLDTHAKARELMQNQCGTSKRVVKRTHGVNA